MAVEVLVVGVVGFLTRKDLVRRNDRRRDRLRKERNMLAAVDEALPCLVALPVPVGVPICAG